MILLILSTYCKTFNACKREDYPFVTRVSAGIAVGAFMDFGRAVDNWRNPNLRARVPRVKRRIFTGAGSFLAAASMKEIRYDGKRRVGNGWAVWCIMTGYGCC